MARWLSQSLEEGAQQKIQAFPRYGEVLQWKKMFKTC